MVLFKKVASDVFGLSDIGAVIKPEDYDKVEADDYVMHEDGEKIYFLIKSKADEFCFTNKALIHVDGERATSKKRGLHRYEYRYHDFSNIALQTAGTIDIDIELNFLVGEHEFALEVEKKYIDEVKDLYKALLKIEEITRDNTILFGYAQHSLELASTTLSNSENKENRLSDEFKEINESSFAWMSEAMDKYHIKDFGHVFEMFINQ